MISRKSPALAPSLLVIGLGLGASAIYVWPQTFTRRASIHDCEAILARIIVLELREQGYRDPALAARRAAELRTQFATDLARCVGRPLPASALECVKKAGSSEAISHHCLP